MRITREELGRRLRLIRQFRGLTQQMVAKAIGINREAVGRIESAERAILGPELAAMAEFLCFRVDVITQTLPDGTWDITACLLPYPAVGA